MDQKEADVRQKDISNVLQALLKTADGNRVADIMAVLPLFLFNLTLQMEDPRAALADYEDYYKKCKLKVTLSEPRLREHWHP